MGATLRERNRAGIDVFITGPDGLGQSADQYVRRTMTWLRGYECRHCGTRLEVDGAELERLDVALVEAEDHPTICVVTVAGQEVHRCVRPPEST
jgi:hypothetical protein